MERSSCLTPTGDTAALNRILFGTPKAGAQSLFFPASTFAAQLSLSFSLAAPCFDNDAVVLSSGVVLHVVLASLCSELNLPASAHQAASAERLVHRGTAQALARLAAAATWRDRGASPLVVAVLGAALRRAAVALLGCIQATLVRAVPLPPKVAAFAALPLRAALSCLDDALGGTRPRDNELAAEAAVAISFSTVTVRLKREAVAAGALRRLVDVAASASVFSARVRARALAAAGNICYACSAADEVAPFVAVLNAEIAAAAANGLPGGGDCDDDIFACEVLYSCLFAATTLAQYSDVRPTIDAAACVNVFSRLHAPARASDPAYARLRDAAARLVAVLELSPAFGRTMREGWVASGGAVRSVATRGDNGGEGPLVHSLTPAAAAADAGYACDFCGGGGADEGRRLPRCARCGVARFCDAACAAAGWPSHKKVCAKKAAPPGRTGEAGGS